MNRKMLRAIEVAVLHLLTSSLAGNLISLFTLRSYCRQRITSLCFQSTSKRTSPNFVSIVITLCSSYACLVWWRSINKF